MPPLPHAADQCLQMLKDMANGVLLLHENVVLRRRALMELMCDHRKQLQQLEPTRQCSSSTVAVHLVPALVTYGHQPTKPSLYRSGRPQLTTAIPN